MGCYAHCFILLTSGTLRKYLFTCLTGSGTRYLHVRLTISTAEARDIRWPTEINIGLNDSLLECIAYTTKLEQIDKFPFLYCFLRNSFIKQINALLIKPLKKKGNIKIK